MDTIKTLRYIKNYEGKLIRPWAQAKAPTHYRFADDESGGMCGHTTPNVLAFLPPTMMDRKDFFQCASAAAQFLNHFDRMFKQAITSEKPGASDNV